MESIKGAEFVATCAEFPSLSWLAPSQIEALQGLQDVLCTASWPSTPPRTA
ncbi:hypothetical protein [Micromonospora sp. NPDC048898]|uniref:hypothetical protein n=1 Tax=Micromonospora sp. NPDC048898 TaxID=3364260 RepID=UPI003712E86B